MYDFLKNNLILENKNLLKPNPTGTNIIFKKYPYAQDLGKQQLQETRFHHENLLIETPINCANKWLLSPPPSLSILMTRSLWPTPETVIVSVHDLLSDGFSPA